MTEYLFPGVAAAAVSFKLCAIMPGLVPALGAIPEREDVPARCRNLPTRLTRFGRTKRD